MHCWLGGDRAGVFLAAYRIVFDGWTPEQALEEMHQYHFHGFWHRNMTAYVKKFPERLNKSEALAPYRHMQSARAVATARGDEIQAANPSARETGTNNPIALDLTVRSAGICRLVDSPALFHGYLNRKTSNRLGPIVAAPYRPRHCSLWPRPNRGKTPSPRACSV